MPAKACALLILFGSRCTATTADEGSALVRMASRCNTAAARRGERAIPATVEAADADAFRSTYRNASLEFFTHVPFTGGSAWTWHLMAAFRPEEVVVLLLERSEGIRGALVAPAVAHTPHATRDRAADAEGGSFRGWGGGRNGGG